MNDDTASSSASAVPHNPSENIQAGTISRTRDVHDESPTPTIETKSASFTWIRTNLWKIGAVLFVIPILMSGYVSFFKRDCSASDFSATASLLQSKLKENAVVTLQKSIRINGCFCAAFQRKALEDYIKNAGAGEQSSTFDLYANGLRVSESELNLSSGTGDTAYSEWKIRTPDRATKTAAEASEGSAGEDSASKEQARSVEEWRSFLSGGTDLGKRDVVLSFKLRGAKEPLSKATLVLPLEIFNFWSLAVGTIGLALLSIGVVLANWKTGLLRDAPSETAPFSLSRVQVGWWLALTLGGFVYIWTVTGWYSNIVTGSVLTLLGISGLSGVSTRVFSDSGTEKKNDSISKGFITDIISDGTSPAIYRIQVLVWNILLGAIFLWSAFFNLQFPQFDQNLLILSALINAVYQGYRQGEVPPTPGQ